MDADLIVDLLELVFDIVFELAAPEPKHTKYRNKTIWDELSTNEPPHSSTTRVVDPNIMHPELYVRPRQQATSSPIKTEPFVEAYDSIYQLIEVEVYLLVYLFQQDDLRITRDEARLIKRHLRPHNTDLKDNDYKRLKQLGQTELSIDVLVEKIKEYNIPDAELKRMLNQLDNVNDVTKRHKRIIEFIRTHLYSELGIM